MDNETKDALITGAVASTGCLGMSLIIALCIGLIIAALSAAIAFGVNVFRWLT